MITPVLVAAPMAQPRRALRRPDVLQKTGLSATTIWNLEQAGDFPRHWMLTPRCAVWWSDEVESWLERRAAMSLKPSTAPDVTLRKHSPGRPPRRAAGTEGGARVSRRGAR